MRRPSNHSFALGLFMVSGAFTFPDSAAAREVSFQAAPPQGFDDLAAERQLIVDTYFGNVKLGELSVRISPGQLRFDDPALLASLLPNIRSAPEVIGALSGALVTNTALVCSRFRNTDCGAFPTNRTGIIFDEERFRVDIFLAPALLAHGDSPSQSYLGDPISGPSLVSRFGATLSGSNRGDRNLHLQNRSIASVGAFRLQSDSSVASGSQPSFDNLTAQLDTKDRRLVGGVFWAPGSDLVGRRKIIGAGVMTQLETRLDKAALAGTPLSIFLQQPARVEILLDGKVISSRIQPAGHRLIDTSDFPAGSYDVALRIQEDGRPARTELRFFSKGSAMAPTGHPQMSAFVGFLQSQGDAGVSFQHRDLFYQASAAYRLAPMVSLDATLVGTQKKGIMEAGAVVSTGFGTVRLLGLTSTAGDVGGVLRASTQGLSSLSASFDLRTVSSRDGQPLLPVSSSGETFSNDPLLSDGARGSYVQAIGVIDYRFRYASLRLSGLYRKNGDDRASYNIAASLEAPLVRRPQWDVRLQADLRKSEQDFGSFIGLRFLLTGGPTALSGTAGISHRAGASGRSMTFVGETQGVWNYQLDDQSDLATDFAFGRNREGSYARGSSNLRSPSVDLRAEALHQFAGGSDNTQLSITADTAIVLGNGELAVGAREASDAAAVASVTGAHPDQEFDVLVDEIVRGRIKGGGRLALFLAPYATYQMRIRARGDSMAGIVDGPQSATLYPGNVAALNWSVTPLVVLFGRAVDANGAIIANADIRGRHGVGRTDESGYFQIEAKPDEILEIRHNSGACKLELLNGDPREGYRSLGDVKCN